MKIATSIAAVVFPALLCASSEPASSKTSTIEIVQGCYFKNLNYKNQKKKQDTRKFLIAFRVKYTSYPKLSDSDLEIYDPNGLLRSYPVFALKPHPNNVLGSFSFVAKRSEDYGITVVIAPPQSVDNPTFYGMIVEADLKRKSDAAPAIFMEGSCAPFPEKDPELAFKKVKELQAIVQ